MCVCMIMYVYNFTCIKTNPCAIMHMPLRDKHASKRAKRNIMKHSNFVHKCIKQNCSIFAPNLACLACLAYIMCCSPCGVNS